MYRQSSVPDLPKTTTTRVEATATTRGTHHHHHHHQPQRQRGDSVRRAASERIINKDGNWLSGAARIDRDEEEEAQQRAKILEQIHFLGNHLAGCMVEFLIEEVEKNVLCAYANANANANANSTMGKGAENDNKEDDNDENFSEQDGEEEEVTEYTDGDFDETDEEEDVLSPISKPRGGIGSLYGYNNSGGNSLLQTQQPLKRGSKNYAQRMYGAGCDSASSPGFGGETAADSSPVMPNRGIRKSAKESSLSPRRGSAQVVGSPKRSSPASLSPRRNSSQVGALPYNNPSKVAASHIIPGQPVISGEEQDDEDENNFLMSSNRTTSSGANGGSSPKELRRNFTFPARLGSGSPTSSSMRSLRKAPSPGISPRTPSRKLGLGRFVQDMDGSANSLPRRPHRSIDEKPLFGNDPMDGSVGSCTLPSPTPSRPLRSRDEKLSTSQQAAGAFQSGAAAASSPKSCPSRPRPTRTLRREAESVRNTYFNKFEQSPSVKQTPGRPGLAPSRLLVKQGSVRHVMGIFESKSRSAKNSRPGMPLLCEDSVKNIVNSLKEEEGDHYGEPSKDENATNHNEAADSSSVVKGPVQPSRTKTPPRINRNFSKSPDGSPKRGVQRNSSGIRMQRFLENRSVGKTNSGVRSFLDTKGSGSSHGSTGSAGLAKAAHVVRKRSGNMVKRGVERTSSGIRRGIPRRTASGTGGKRGMPRRQFSFGRSAGTTKSSSFGMFAKDKVTNKLSHDTRKQKRIFKTQNALRKLRKAAEAGHTPGYRDGSESSFDDFDMAQLLGTMTLPLPCGVKHDCALLFVDISGFTQLSTTLKVEKLSKTINAYFQLIVEHVQAFGGDILKFAGDAVFVEWRASASTLLEGNKDDPMGGTYGGEGLGAEKAVITAAACAARIIDKCADYKVYDESGKKVATLNLHCAIGFGEVIGVHLGNSDRMEYFIIGEPITQVAKAMDLGKMGEVVASPACLKYLDGEYSDHPKVILSKTNKLMNPKLMLVKASKKSKNMLAHRLDDWDVPALKSLQKLMSPYVHPVVVENQLFQKGYGSAQERFTSEAEIRDVFTVFIQPIVSTQVTGNRSEDKEVLKSLHDIMVIVNNELRRFKGQLRQYTVDDKGIVLIANFGLRGSTFPEMVERLAMPFATNVQQILKTKLDVDCKMGATFGKAYCGVVGGVERHEYAVLGPSVNLAARLMANRSNKGFLVDEEVQRKASNRGFEGLPPVKAKGYKHLVPIFEPMLHHRRSWGSQGADFVGRTAETKQILKLAEDVIDASTSTSMVWVSAESGYGKSALLGQATDRISDLCSSKSATHVIVCHVCSDADSFQPLSVVGPLCLDILAFVRRTKSEDSYKKPAGFDEIATLAKAGSEKAPSQVLGACRDAEVPDSYIRSICKLLIAQSWPTEADESSRELEMREVARYIVTVLLQSTIHLDFVVWAVDDIPHADRLSWMVLELLHQYSCNFMLLMGSRPVVGTDMNVNLQFWEHLHGEGKEDGTFAPLELKAMTKDDLGLLVKRYASKNDWHASVDLSSITKEVFVQSGGVPNLAAQILEKRSSRSTRKVEVKPQKYVSNKNKKPGNSLDRLGMMQDSFRPSSSSLGSESAQSASVAQVGEHMLHRMDLLTPEARTHINLGAILGPAFESADVISVMERYRGISDRDRNDHRESVLESLAQAAESGILEEDLTGAGDSMSFCAQENFMGQESITYKFTHDDWRKNILKGVLDSWKRAMYLLLAESLEAQFEFNTARPDREIRKLFDPFKGGKKKGKNISVASELALKIGEKMERNGKGIHSLKIYQKALDLWQKPDNEKDILVMSEEHNEDPSDELLGEDLEYVLKLNAAMGRCAMLLMNKDKSTTAFQANLDLIPDSKDLKEPALLFPSYCGRFYSLRLARKIDHEPEADFVYGFVEEAEAHEDKIHQLQALAMEAEIFGRNGEFAKALEASTDLRKQYDVSAHSSDLVEFYGDDYSAQCIAQSASWHFQLKQEAKAMEICEYIIEILPSLAAPSQFLALFPVLWVLKDTPGQVERALSLCREYLVVEETKQIESMDGSEENMPNWDDDAANDDDSRQPFSPFQVLFKPITMLMDLAVGIKDHSTVLDYVDWALDASQSDFDKGFNTFTGSMGRNANSITAEICLSLATHNAASSAKHNLMSRASALVSTSMKLTKYMPSAYQQVKGFAYDKKFRGL